MTNSIVKQFTKSIRGAISLITMIQRQLLWNLCLKLQSRNNNSNWNKNNLKINCPWIHRGLFQMECLGLLYHLWRKWRSVEKSMGILSTVLAVKLLKKTNQIKRQIRKLLAFSFKMAHRIKVKSITLKNFTVKEN